MSCYISEGLSLNDDWIHSIITKNAEKTGDILTNLHGPSVTSSLLHSQLSIPSPMDTYWTSTRMASILPFHLAVICHAKDVVKCMVQHGVDVTQVDDKGNNVLHTLVNVSSHPLRENDRNAVTMYHNLMKLFSEHNKKFCLHQGDAKGLRPLELAASLGHFWLMNAIFYTHGVYFCKTEVHGFQLLQYFRVTEYENFKNSKLGNRPDRDHVSPLRLMVQLDSCSLDMMQAKSTILCAPLLTWALTKLQMNWWFLFFCTLFIVTEIMSFFMVTLPRRINIEVTTNMSVANVTNLISNTTMTICIANLEQNTLALSFVICISFIATFANVYGILHSNTFQLIINKFTFRNITSSGSCLVAELCSSIMMVTYCFLSLWLSPNTKSAVAVFHSLYLGSIFCTTRRLNYGSIPVEWVRKYAMTMASIVSDFGDILIIFLSISLVFGSLLNHLLVFDVPHSFLEMPLSYLHSFYKSFLILLNIEQAGNIETNYNFLIQIFHITGYFTIVILLFHFLIASMVNTYSYIRSNSGVYTIMYRLDVAFRFQDRIPPIIARLYSYFMRKTFVFEDGEVYVVCLTNISTSNLTDLDNDNECYWRFLNDAIVDFCHQNNICVNCNIGSTHKFLSSSHTRCCHNTNLCYIGSYKHIRQLCLGIVIFMIVDRRSIYLDITTVYLNGWQIGKLWIIFGYIYIDDIYV